MIFSRNSNERVITETLFSSDVTRAEVDRVPFRVGGYFKGTLEINSVPPLVILR